MRKTLTVILLGASWAVLAGCEQQGQDTLPEPADGLPQNEAPRTDPDVQIGRSDSVERVEPVEPAQPGGAGPDLELEGDQPQN